jgi:hypothetical protein
VSEDVSEIVRRNGSRERYQSISLKNHYGQGDVLDIALDLDGKSVRQVELQKVKRIEILGPSGIRDASGRLLKNCWSLARIHRVKDNPLENVYVNPHGIGGWEWFYDTGVWRGKIDDEVVDIFLARGSR